jgi:hypothetical protein
VLEQACAVEGIGDDVRLWMCDEMGTPGVTCLRYPVDDAASFVRALLPRSDKTGLLAMVLLGRPLPLESIELVLESERRSHPLAYLWAHNDDVMTPEMRAEIAGRITRGLNNVSTPDATPDADGISPVAREMMHHARRDPEVKAERPGPVEYPLSYLDVPVPELNAWLDAAAGREKTMARVAYLIGSRTGPELRRWQLLVNLIETFPGTLGQLLDGLDAFEKAVA